MNTPAAILILAAVLAGQDGQPLPGSLARWLEPQLWVRDTGGPILGLGSAGAFDDTHLLTPEVARHGDGFRMWYTGSRGAVADRVFALGIADSADGRRFFRRPGNPVLRLDRDRSILTPALLRHPDGSAARRDGRLQLYFTAADLTRRDAPHTIHLSTSADGVSWSEPTPALVRDGYAPTVLAVDGGYRMWFVDVSGPAWLVRHASSDDGIRWRPDPKPCLRVDQDWERGNLFYPTVLRIDGAYVMWYGSYWRGHGARTALGVAVSADGRRWHKSPHNPVFRPDPKRPFESHYTTSQSVMRLADGRFRIWYSSRKAPPHVNKYFAMGTARWDGPRLPPLPEPASSPDRFRRAQGELRRRLRRMLGIPEPGGELQAESRGRVDHEGLVIEKWVFTAEPGSRVPAVVYRSKGGPARRPAVVLTYGHGGSKSQPSYQYIAQALARTGVVVLAMDPIGEEERHVEGRLGTRAHDPAAVHQRAWRAGRPIMGKLVFDAMRGVDFLRARTDVDPRRIGVTGNSLGGAVAGWVATLDPRLRCAVVSGWAFGEDTVESGKLCTREPNRHLLAASTWRDYLALTVPQCAMLVINGDADVIIDRQGKGRAWRDTARHVAAAARIAAAAGRPGHLSTWLVPGGGHRPYPAHRRGLGFLVEHLEPSGFDRQRAEALPEIGFGAWAKRFGIRFERLYGTELHLAGATVVDLKVRPLPKRALACLRDVERGAPEFTLQGWLESRAR